MITRNSKRIVTLILCFTMFTILILQIGIGFASTQDVQVPNVKENIFVYDSENLLSSIQNDSLNSLLRFLENKTSIEFAVITTPSFNGLTIEDYAHDLFNTLEIGKANKDNGVLLLLSKSEGHARLEIGYGLENLLTDGMCGRILDDYYVPNRDKGNHVDSLLQTANGVLAVLGQEYGIELVNNQESIVKSVKNESKISTLGVIIIIIVVLLLVVFLEVASEESGSSSSSGGFFSGGGFSSGGGFGGGHSGGGGASR